MISDSLFVVHGENPTLFSIGYEKEISRVVDRLALHLPRSRECSLFNRAIRGQLWMPKYLSSDNDPLYRFQQWHANPRILEVTGIKSIPYVPLSHPFLERLIGTIRREYWITRCSEQRQISKTSCSISGPTSTTIARITH